MKNKFFISDSRIAELTRRGNEIATPADISRLHAIGKRYGFDPTGNRRDNLARFWGVICGRIDALPKGDRFRESINAAFWDLRLTDRGLIEDYIRHISAWADYEFLSLPQWNDLEKFTADTRFLGMEPRAQEFIKNGGDYYGFFAQYGKRHCETSLVKYSTDLRKQIEAFFKECSTDEQRFTLVNAVETLGHTPAMDEGDFHSLIFPPR